MPLGPGTRLGPYEIQSAIGAGGMGEVYRGRDTHLQRDVAIKVLPDLFASDPERLARLKREAQMLASLNHPNIAAIYGLEDSDRTQALILELVEGETLADRIARGPIPLDEALPIAKQIVEALEAAHEQGIIHRDLKPANIKVRGDGAVKVLDFGLAKLTGPAESGPHARDVGAGFSRPDASMSPTITSPAMTGVGMLLGTAAYMAPEQAKGRPADKRSDLWAFGCVLYEVLTGKRPFVGEDVADTLAAVLMREPDWGALPSNTPSSIQKLLRRCLQKDRKRRLADAADARLEIEEALEQPAVPVTSATASAATPSRRTAWVVAAAALVVAAALGALAYVVSNGPERRMTVLDVITPAASDPFSFALSPEGRQLASVAYTEGNAPRLWVRPLDRAAGRALPGTEGAQYPFWSPDGRFIAFFADGQLKRVDVGSGAVGTIAVASLARGGTWGADGTILLGSTGGPIMRVPAAGGALTPATQLMRGQVAHRFPSFLPDGRHFLFITSLGEPETRGIYVASLDGGAPRRLLAADYAALYAQPGYLLVVSQGALTARRFDAKALEINGEPFVIAQGGLGDTGVLGQPSVSVSRQGLVAYRGGGGGRRQLTWFDRTGKAIGVVGPADNASPATPNLTRDGSRVSVGRVALGNVDVWVEDVARATMTRFTFDSGVDALPVWSPDGRRIAFFSSRNGRFDLFARPADGSADEQPILTSSLDKAPLDWSSDGRFLLYAVQDPKNAADLWALPFTGADPKPFPVVQTPFDDVHGQFSPDGRLVAYASNESGRYEIYVRPFPGPGGKVQVSTGGGIYPRWGRDGKELFFVSPDNHIMAAAVGAGSDFNAGTPQPLLAAPLLSTGGNIGIGGFASRAEYAVAADGRFLLNLTAGEAATSPITIVQNWDIGLKR